jgi:hypothetical protein
MLKRIHMHVENSNSNHSMYFLKRYSLLFDYLNWTNDCFDQEYRMMSVQHSFVTMLLSLLKIRLSILLHKNHTVYVLLAFYSINRYRSHARLEILRLFFLLTEWASWLHDKRLIFFTDLLCQQNANFPGTCATTAWFRMP